MVCTPKVYRFFPCHFGLFSHNERPYLHVYKHSNEVEEVTVISLDGVNVESNPEMELLLGVSAVYFPPRKRC
jgi:hypothetical protein